MGMTVEQFIESNINTARGAYSPSDVVELVRRAWAEGAMEAREHVIEIVEENIRV